MNQLKHTPGPWVIKRSFNGYRITRTWSSGWYQVMRAGRLLTEADAIAAIVKATGGAA